MESSYRYGMKMAGIAIHQFFTILFVVSLFMLATLLGKSMLVTTDIGEASFKNSGYYLSTLGKKYYQLNEYLYLEQMRDELSDEEKRLYLEYTNTFQTEQSNFRYWCEVDGILYTNVDNEKKKFDKETVQKEARKSGDYLIYDEASYEFETNIRGIERYYFHPNDTHYIKKIQESFLIISVDTDFPYVDDLSEAKVEYENLHPWAKSVLVLSILGVIGWVVSLVYLTLIAGKKREEEGIELYAVDKIKTEIMFCLFLVFFYGLIVLCAKVSREAWNLAGILVAAGTVGWVADSLFLVFYLSMVRRLKAEALWSNSLTLFLKKGIEKIIKERKITTRVLLILGIQTACFFLLAEGSFRYKSKCCMCLMFLLWAWDGYYILRKSVEHYQVIQGIREISSGSLEFKIETQELHGDDKILAEAVNHIGEGLHCAVDESTKNERMKADLITNVSHDIKTPLTSIINYVNLIKREDIQNERVKQYIRILDEKSMRLKQLTEDLVEASKISSGNIKLDFQVIDFVELICQTGGEFNEKFEEKKLTIVTKLPKESVSVYADGRQLYRVIENLYNNAAKYALSETRVYVELTTDGEKAVFSMKNVSENSLAMENQVTEDLTERFIRGDVSRSTEGSGLGLSIAKNLTQLMNGSFAIGVDGDLFKASIVFPIWKKDEEEKKK